LLKSKLSVAVFAVAVQSYWGTRLMIGAQMPRAAEVAGCGGQIVNYCQIASADK
jgi:hypothetical protein